MTNLSFTQEYYLCMLNPKGSIPTLKSIELSACLVASSLLELLSDGYIAINDENKILIVKSLDESKSYLEPLYNTIKSSKPTTIKGIANKYIVSTHKRFNELYQAIGKSMTQEDLVSEKQERGLLHTKTLFIPASNEVTKIVEKIRAEFLEEGTVSDKTLILGALLHQSGLIKNYFSKFEANKLKDRLDEIKNSEAHSLVKEILDYLNLIIILVSTC